MPRPLVLGWIDPNDLLTLNIAELLAPVETCWNNILVGCPVNALEIAGISMVQRQYPKWCDGAAGTRGLLMVTWFYPTVRKTHTAQITCKCSSNMYIIFFGGVKFQLQIQIHLHIPLLSNCRWISQGSVVFKTALEHYLETDTGNHIERRFFNQLVELECGVS